MPVFFRDLGIGYDWGFDIDHCRDDSFCGIIAYSGTLGKWRWRWRFACKIGAEILSVIRCSFRGMEMAPPASARAGARQASSDRYSDPTTFAGFEIR